MSCTITYKGKKYSEEQFKEYFINNKQEFATSIAKNKDVIEGFKEFTQGKQFQKLTAEEKAKTIEQVTKEHRSIVALKDLSAKLAYRIGGKVTFENNPNADWKGYNQGNTSVLNEAYMTPDTPFHEILAHPIIRAIKESDFYKRVNNSYDFIEWVENNKPEYKPAPFMEGIMSEKRLKEAYDKYRKEFEKLYPNKSNTFNSLYQSLLKELEIGRGKEVFEQVKRDYVGKKDFILEFNNIVEKDGNFVLVNNKGNTLKLKDNKSSVDRIFLSKEEAAQYLQDNKYTLEEQQEEAIVTLLGMMAADKLDVKKDATLISKLKELWKQISDFVKSLLKQDGIKIDELPITTTLNDLAEIMAYGNNKIILPGYKVEYSTPLGNKYDTLEEVNNEIRGLADANVEVDLSGVKIDKELSKEELEKIKELQSQKKEKEDYFISKKYQQDKDFELYRLNKQLDELKNKKVEFYSQEPFLNLEDKNKYGFQDFDYIRVESTYGRGNKYHKDILGENYEGYYIHGYNTSTGKPKKKILPISREQAIKIWEKDATSKYEAEDQQDIYRLEDSIRNLKDDSKIKWEIKDLEQQIERVKKGENSIQGFIEKDKEYAQSREIIEQWKKENNIQYDPEEVYSRGQGFYSSIGAYSNLELDLLFQNLLQHIEDNKKAGGEFTISAFTKPVNSRLKHIEGTGDRVRFVIYPKSNHIKWAAPTDVYSGSVWDAHEKVSKDKKSELLGVSFTKAPALRNINEVSPNLADIIDNLSHAHNELGIELTTNNFRIEYDDNIDYSTKKLIDNINKILDDKYGKLEKPEIKKEVSIQKQYRFGNETYDTYQEAKAEVDKFIGTEQNEVLGFDYSDIKEIQKPIGKQPTQTRENTTSIESVKSKVLSPIHQQYGDSQSKEAIEADYKDGIITKEERDSLLAKEYTEQALINTKIAKLKEVAKKYPRSLITSKVVPINPNMVDNSEIQYSKKQGYNPEKITDEYGNGWYNIKIKNDYKKTILFQKKENTPKTNFNEELNDKIKAKLQQLFPQIKLEYSNKVVDENGNEVRGLANIEALKVLINSVEQNQDTLPHEYVHHYIAWYRNSPIVKRAIERFGSEEKLVQAIGERVTDSFKVQSFLERFWKYIKSLFTSDVVDDLTNYFLQNKELGQINETSGYDTQYQKIVSDDVRDDEMTDNIWQKVKEEENKLISQQFEHITATRTQKQTVEKVMAFSNDLGGTTDKNYILKNNTVLKRASTVIDEDPRFRFEDKDFDEEKYTINRQWGNQIDDVLRAVILYRFDENQEAKVLEEIKKQREKRQEDSVMSDNVTYKLISEFNKFCKKNGEKILVPQAFLYNEEAKIGGTADIIMIDKFGNVQVVDLKSSLYPVGWNGNYFESYDKEGNDGKTYKNSYIKEFGENRGSKKQRHEAQTSMYIGMLMARGINYSESSPIQILPVHIKELEEYSEEMIEDVVVERDDAPMDLNNDYLRKVNSDSEHTNRILDTYETDFELNKNKLIVFIKTEIQLLNNFNDKKSKYRVKELKELLKKLDDVSVANASKISSYIKDLHKTFVSGEHALIKQIRTLTRKIKSGDINDVNKAIEELLKYKEKIVLLTPLINDLEEFYRDISEDNINENDPESMLYKLDELLNTFRQIDDKFYKKTINPLIAKRYAKFSSSKQSNEQVEQRVKRLKERLSALNTRLQETQSNEESILNNGKIKLLNFKISTISNNIERLENNAIVTEETILKQLNEGSYEDISFFQKVALAPQSSSNVFIAGTAKIIDGIWDNIRMTLIKVQEDIHEAFEEFASTNTKNRNNPKEFNEGLYETITTGYIQDKQLTTVEDVALIQKTDITKYNKERQKFLETIKDLDGKQYWEEYNKWYSQNTEDLPMSDEIVDGQVIREGLNSIIEDKKQDVKNDIITQGQYELWFDNAFNTRKENGKTVISGVRFDTKEGRQLRRPSSDKYTNPKWLELQKDASKLKYYNKLLTTYFKSQENYPSRKSHEHRFILPYINKSDLNRISENGIKDEAKEKAKRLFSESADEQKKNYGESQIKVIPILYNDRIEPKDVSLDLAQSILKYESASQEFKARVEIEPIMKSLLYSVSENKPIKTDSKGKAVVMKFAENLNLPGFDKYVKEGESNIEALLKYYLDNMIYGISREKAEVAGIDLHTVVDKLSGVISKTSLGLPFGLFGNVANWLQAEAQTVIEGHAKQFFDNKTYLWAEKEYLKHTNDFLKDMTAPIKTTFIGQMIELYDPFTGEFKDKYGHNISKDKMRVAMTSSPAFFLQNLGEHHVQIKTMLAFLKTTKIKDASGKEIPLYEAYTNLDENGIEGKLRLKDGIDLSQLGETTINQMLPLSVKNKMSSVLRKTHGNYSSMTAPMMRKYWYCRVIEFMRRFFATSVEKRWRQTRYNFEEENLTEGYQRTFWRLLTTEFKELYNVGFGFATGKESNLTDLEIANVRRNAMDIAFIMITGLLVMMLTAMMKNADTPEEKDKIALFLAPVMRLNAELSAFGQIGDPSRGFGLLPDIGDIKRNISNPTVMYGYITKSIHFIDQIPKDISSLIITGDIQRYQKDTGFWDKGDSKLMAKFLALFGASPSKMDLTESIKTLQMIQNK